jgi:hypothetical protein
MATGTLGVSGGTSTGASSMAFSSFTPAADDLLVVIVGANGSRAAASLTSDVSGDTFVEFARRDFGTTSSIYAYVAEQLATNTPQVLTWDCTGDAFGAAGYAVIRYSGVTRTGLAAILQSAEDNGGSGETPECIFASSALTGNPTLAAFFIAVNTAITEPSGWTELNDTGGTSRRIETANRDSGFTGTTITWGGAAGAGTWGAITAEIDTSAAGGGTIEEADGTASGTGGASGVGASTAAAAASASGAGAASGVGRSTAESAASAAGVGAASGVGASTAASVGSASGTGAATGVGASTAAAVGSAAGIGAATGVGAQDGIQSGDGSAAGVGAAAAVGASTAAAAGAASGLGAASATGTGIIAAVGSATGTSAVSAAGSATIAAIGAAIGSSDAAAIGAAIWAAIGSAAGIGTAEGISDATQPEVPVMRRAKSGAGRTVKSGPGRSASI